MTPSPEESDPKPLLLVRGDATEEEVAALVAVLQGLASAASAAGPAGEPERASSWAAPSRKLRTTPPAGPGGWRASSLPR